MTLLEEIAAKLAVMPADQKAALTKEVMAATGHMKFLPNAGPQTEAYYCKADVLFYGGAGGGGKSALGIGLAINEHKRSVLARRQYTDLGEMIDQAIRFNGTRDGFNGSAPPKLRTKDGRLLEFIAAAKLGDEQHRQGQPMDLLYVDEAAHFLEEQIRFWMGWLRTTEPGQRCRVVLGSNPPLSSEGQWLIAMFAPWLDPTHPNPAKPGELRWYVTDAEGKDKEVPGPELVRIGAKMVQPQSRTFIPAALKDNPYLAGSGYEARLDALQEPLRSAIRDGNFMAAREDDQWQVIPTAWVLQAQKRWTPTPPMNAPMCSLGVDVAQGGSAQTVLAPRFDWWFGDLITVPGKDTPLGTDVAALIFKHRRNDAQTVIDVGGGFGLGAFEHLKLNRIPVVGYNGAHTSNGRTKDGRLAFYNKRAESWWRLREALDPDQPNGSPIALPYDSELVADLTAVRYEVTPRGIKCEDKDEVVKRLGRSPDKGDSVVMAWSQGATSATHHQIWKKAVASQHRPQVNRGHTLQKQRR